jgi:hypothetical protein
MAKWPIRELETNFLMITWMNKFDKKKRLNLAIQPLHQFKYFPLYTFFFNTGFLTGKIT